MLIEQLRKFLEERRAHIKRRTATLDSAALAGEFGFSERRKGKTEVVLSSDVAVELGHPSTDSHAVVLTADRAGLVLPGMVSIVGPDLFDMNGGRHHPFAQIVLLYLKPGQNPDPYEVDNTQYLMHRLPGYMVRSVPGRLWVRISKKALSAGLTFETVGSALIAAYREGFEEVQSAEIVFVTSGASDVRALSIIAAEAEIIAGKHKKLALGLDGELECAELDCETCDEKPVCDSLRDIIIKRRETS